VVWSSRVRSSPSPILELFVNKIRSNWKNPIQGTETLLSAQVYFKYREPAGSPASH